MSEEFMFTFQEITENRFIVYFKEPLSIPSHMVKKISPIRWVNYKWEPVTFYFYDIVTPSTKQSLQDTIDHSNDRFDIEVVHLGPVGDKVSECHLINCTLTVIDFGNNDYSSNLSRTLTMTVQPESCKIIY